MLRFNVDCGYEPIDHFARRVGLRAAVLTYLLAIVAKLKPTEVTSNGTSTEFSLYPPTGSGELIFLVDFSAGTMALMFRSGKHGRPQFVNVAGCDSDYSKMALDFFTLVDAKTGTVRIERADQICLVFQALAEAANEIWELVSVTK